MSDPSRCAHCGRTDIATIAWVTVFLKPVCAPATPGRPNCALLVDRFGHPFDCRCEERYPVAGDRNMTVWA